MPDDRPASTSSVNETASVVKSPARRGLIYAGVGLLAAGAGAGAAWWTRHAASPALLGGEFWAQRFPRLDGDDLVLDGLRGKPLLINFWATWCTPCVEEMPMLDAFVKQNAANGLQLLGLAIDQPSAVRKFLQRTPVSYPIALAGLGGTELMRALGNTQGGLPFTLAIGADGRETGRKMGKLELADLQNWRRELLHG